MCFTNDMPIAGHPANRNKIPAGKAGRTALTKARPGSALVIDDDEIYRELVKAMLTRNGWQVDVAWDGQIGWQMAQLRDYALVVCDIVMPNQEGLETIRLLRRYRAELPIIAMSGGGIFRTDHYLRMALWFGADKALEKPFEAEALHAAIGEIAQGRAAGLAVLNRHVFDQLHEALRPDSLRKLAERFIAETEDRLVRIREAASRGDISIARREAHTLKTGAALFGLSWLSDASATLEAAATNDHDIAAEVSAVAAAVEPSFHSLRETFTSF